MSELEGKVALVTGASGGIGAAVAARLHETGASIGLLSRRGDDLGLERGLGVRCDVRDRGQVERATAELVERFGRLDIAVANAGVGAYGPFLELDPEQLEAMIDVNLKGVLYTAAAALPHLIDSGAGDFVSLASVAGVRAFPRRGRLQRLEVRAGRLHARARPRAPRARRPEVLGRATLVLDSLQDLDGDAIEGGGLR